MEKKNKIGKIVGAIGACVVLLGAGIGTGFVLDKDVDVPALKAAAFAKGAASITPEIEIETVTETVFESREVLGEVDNGNLELVLDHIFDNEGNISYLTDDLDDDEVDQIVNRIVFINEIKGLAVAEVEDEFKDLMDKENFIDGNSTILYKFFDEDDIERVRVQDDSDEVTVIDPDFDDRDADVEIEVKFEQDDVKYLAVVNVEFKDGEVDDLDLISVVER